MFDRNKHKIYLFQILKDIFEDKTLNTLLGFKGGTALMFFYDLPRFSVDLDFNLLDKSREDEVYPKLRDIILKYGKIHDEAVKHYGIICVLDYGFGERKLKVEVSNRDYGDSYEIKNLFGVNIHVMRQADMFAHKLCALLDRSSIINRDIFDTWFFLQNKTPINAEIVELRTGMVLSEYIQLCINQLENMSQHKILDGLGELVDEDMKTFVRNQLVKELVSYLKFYKEFPIL